ENGISAIIGFGVGVQTHGRASLPTLNKISIYPNPTTGRFSIIGIDKNAQIEILNMQGRLVLGTDARPCIYTAPGVSKNLSGKPPGIYMVRVITNGQTIYKKLILH
nr:T9SS type A sorting domain-containing protein [Bacteroidota bacterium]